MKLFSLHLPLLAGLLLLSLLNLGACQGRPESAPDRCTMAERPTLRFFTAPTATTPQLALWSAQAAGRLDPLFSIETEFWKEVDSLQTLLLAGRGDIWLGHIEGFARARQLGAPVTLLAVSGWRKFYLLCRDPNIKGFADLQGQTLPFTPRGSPAVPILQQLLPKTERPISFLPRNTEMLGLLLSGGNFPCALAPEPLASLLLHKQPDLRVVDSVADFYGRATGKAARLPWAGLAVNSHTIKRFPDLIRQLSAILVEESLQLAQKSPAEQLALLPPQIHELIPQPVLRASLQRDMLLLLSAQEAEAEVREYLQLLDPSMTVDQAFFYHSAGQD